MRKHVHDVIIIVVCYPLPFSGNVVRACKIISRLASRTHLHIKKTAFVCRISTKAKKTKG